MYVLLLPAVIYVFIFNYMPLYGVQIAFRDYSTRAGIWEANGWGWNISENLSSFPNFWLLIKNTLEIGALFHRDLSLLRHLCADAEPR